MAVMFQIVCALVLDVPAPAECFTNVHGVSPNVLLSCEPWGHINHSGSECCCRSSNHTGAYVHEITFHHPVSTSEPAAVLSHHQPASGGDVLPAAGVPGVLASLSDGVPSVRPGLVPFVSDRAGAYGRLLLATHERMMTGLAACDWLTVIGSGQCPGEKLWTLLNHYNLTPV